MRKRSQMPAHLSSRHRTLEVSGASFWTALALLLLSIITAASILWTTDHPYGTWWDEARYINRAHLDLLLIKNQGGVGFVRTLLDGNQTLPPAFRLLALPFTASSGVTPTFVRIISLAALWGTVIFVYLAGRRLAGPAAGAFAVSLVILSPAIVKSSKQFLTEYPLYLAIAAMLYFLFRSWDVKQQESRGWIGLGLALGLGILAKASFIFVSAPVLLLAAVLKRRHLVALPDLPLLLKAVGTGLVFALPWWWVNLQSAIGYSQTTQTSDRLSLGPPGSPETMLRWLTLMTQSGFGPAALVVVLGILAMSLAKARLGWRLDRTQAKGSGACAAAALPLMVAVYVVHGDRLRYVSPAFLPIAVALGVLATAIGWTTSRWLTLGTAVLFCLQAAAMVAPVIGASGGNAAILTAVTRAFGSPVASVMQRSEQWDWGKLREMCRTHGLDNPSIAYLGNASTLNPPQIRFPWVRVNKDIRVAWLWRYEQGPIDWDSVMSAVDSSSVVLVAPGLIGDSTEGEDLDNQHNVEFFRRMQRHPGFSEPITLEMGRLAQVRLFAFLRKAD